MVRSKNRRRLIGLSALTALLLALLPLSAFAQGSIFGSVTNSDATTPANGEMSFFGFLDDTDEELRIETSTGAGYDNGNWFDDFQNYLTEAPGNPYDYHFFNIANGEGFHLEGLIPDNSFQQEDIQLAAVTWPAKPVGVTGSALSSGSVLLEWNGTTGVTYHVYRRSALSNGSFFRLDNTAGSLTDPGTADSFFVDNTVDGASSYEYLVIAEDGSGNYSQHSDVITVNSATNAAPVVTAISPDSGLTLGGQTITISGSGFDPAGVTADLGGFAVTGITVVSPYEITGTTGAGTAGTVDVTVTNTASTLSGTLAGAFTYVQNSPPVLATIGAQAVTEGNLLTITPSATDADADIPVMSTSTLPSGATFVDNGDGTGTFEWTPGFLESGSYSVTFYATDAVVPSLVDSEQVAITVNDAGNQLPVLAAIGAQSTTEDVNLTFGVSATDAESTPALTTSALPGTATFVDNGDGTGTFDWTPDFTDAGTYDVTFYATDDSTAVDSEIVSITVNDAGNQSPVLAAIGSQSTTENVQLLFGVSASDADGTIPTLTTSTLPGTATFVDNGDGTGAFDWTPSFTDAGTYSVTFYASDGVAIDSEVVSITVNDAGNQAPVLATIGAQSTTEGIQLLFGVSASDVDGTIPALTATNLPTGASFVDNGDGTGTFDWTPGFTDAGSYDVTFTASDGSLTDDEIVTITVNEAGNQAPILDSIGAQSGTEGVQLLFGVSASDPDATIPSLTATNLPTGATFVDNGDGIGTFDWTPGFTDAGTYSVTFTASDGSLTDNEIVDITILDAGNQAPVLDPIGSQSTTEGVQLLFGVTASDADGTIPALSTSTLPTGATFTDNGDGTGTFDWTPAFTDAGTYPVTFYASDGGASDSEVVDIVVNEAGNQAPVLDPIGAQATTEGVQLLVNVTSSDPDGTLPELTATGLPTGAIFVDNGDGTGTFDWTPGFTDAGTYSVTFFADDGLALDSEVVAIDVLESGNQPPVLDPIGAQTGTEDVQLLFSVTASDPDATIPALGAADLPTGAIFVDNGDGTGTFDWTPGFTDAGTYNVTFFASDGVLADSEIVAITINDVGNQPPVLDSIGPQTTAEAVQLLFTVTASDVDGTIPTLAATGLPTGALFVDNGDGSGTFDWTPDPVSAGTYDVTFSATDGLASDSEVVTITVTDSNQVPVLAAIGSQIVDENVLLNFVVTASDVDGDIPLLTAATVPPGAVFADNGDGTASFDWTPTFSDSGTYTTTFYATDGLDPALVDSEVVTITANNVNQLPDLTPIGTQSINEGGTLAFTTFATDADGDTPVLTASTLPGTATYVDSGNGMGYFEWVTTFADAGSYQVTFYAADSAFPTVIDSEVVTINVGEVGNQPPQWTLINDTTVNEGGTLVLNVSATDYEGNAISLAVNTTMESGDYTFVDNGDGTGVFTYTPDYKDAGLDSVRFIASDDASPPLSQVMKIAVTTVDVNQPPTFDPAGPFAVDAEDSLIFTVSAFDSTDADSGRLYLSILDLPSGATFVDNGDNSGAFRWAPTLAQVGVDTVNFVAVDDGTPAQTGQLAVQITVRSIDQTPVLDPIGPQQILEGNTLTVNLSGSDPDGTIPSFTVKNPPANSSLTDNGDGTAVWTFSPSFVQSGLYSVEFRATDGNSFDKEVVSVQVLEAGDQLPTFTYVPNPSVVENDTLVDSVMAEDPDGDPVEMLIDSATIPPNFTYTDQGGGVAIFEFTPDFTQSGTFVIDVIVATATGNDTTQLLIDVIEFGNNDPVLASIANQTVAEFQNLSFTVNSGDIDGVTPILSAAPLPAGATFTDNGNGSGTFSWTPGDVAGDYTVTFYANDGDPSFTATSADSQDVLITVTNVNRKPGVFVTPTGADFNEGETAQLSITAWDDDGTVPTVSPHLQGVDSLATNMTYVSDSTTADGFVYGRLIFSPDFTQGNNDPTFYYTRVVVIDAEDPAVSDSSGTQTWRVFDVPQAPVLSFPDGPGPFSLVEGDTLSFRVSASDPDAEGIPTLRAENLPANATSSVAVNTITITFTPDFTQAGSYQVRVIATDPGTSGLTDTALIDITVTEAGNQTPTFTSTHADTVIVYVGVTHTTTVTAEDLDGDPMTLSAAPIMTGGSFFDYGDGTGDYVIDPDLGDVNTYTEVLFTVTDSPAGASSSMTITYWVLSFTRGDLDGNSTYTMNDIVYISNYLFRGGDAPQPMSAGDVDLNGTVEISDLVYLINFLYKSGPRPPQ